MFPLIDVHRPIPMIQLCHCHSVHDFASGMKIWGGDLTFNAVSHDLKRENLRDSSAVNNNTRSSRKIHVQESCNYAQYIFLSKQ